MCLRHINLSVKQMLSMTAMCFECHSSDSLEFHHKFDKRSQFIPRFVPRFVLSAACAFCTSFCLVGQRVADELWQRAVARALLCAGLLCVLGFPAQCRVVCAATI